MDKIDDMVGFLVQFKYDVRLDLDVSNDEKDMIWFIDGLDRF
mgnify:CR=1 FL=1|jgi:hypothetical protein